jgi:glycerol-3-phosphate acyltransferase PlsY
MLYLVDSFKYAASALAASSVLRSLFGFVFPLFAQQMFDKLHNGGGYSLLAGLAIVVGVPFPIWIYYYGEKVRARSDMNR